MTEHVRTIGLTTADDAAFRAPAPLVSGDNAGVIRKGPFPDPPLDWRGFPVSNQARTTYSSASHMLVLTDEVRVGDGGSGQWTGERGDGEQHWNPPQGMRAPTDGNKDRYFSPPLFQVIELSIILYTYEKFFCLGIEACLGRQLSLLPIKIAVSFVPFLADVSLRDGQSGLSLEKEQSFHHGFQGE
ncbi:hypothetical protein BHE74_00052307 [Ensete ventricosum]|nr:hypothetical protein BHE74_00052307 [Ensete ventricosum]RZS23551.1 hypothetical protein BHM03_00056510 [Ensete ventricosum]